MLAGGSSACDRVPHPRHALGGYREYAAEGELAAFAEAWWIHRTAAQARLSGAAHRVLPDPSLSLAFTCFRDEAGPPREPRLLLLGPVTTPRAFPLQPGFEMAAVKLKLEWAEPVLDLAPGDHPDVLDDFAPILPRVGEPLFEALLVTGSAREAVHVIAAYLARRTRARPARHSPATLRAMDLARRTAGRLTVQRLAQLAGSSPRQLRRAVHQETGMTLKAYSRTVRFLRAVTAADRSGRPAWARLAADAGYCDQSHLIRDCRALCGLAPHRLYRERRAEAELSNRS